jgi:hypothetical protein
MILPFMEMDSSYQLMNFDVGHSPRLLNAGVILNVNYTTYALVAGSFLCPSDAIGNRKTTENNYRYNFGGSTPFAGAQNWSTNFSGLNGPGLNGLPIGGNGAFTIGTPLRVKDFTDGLSRTAFFSERLRGSGVTVSNTRIDRQRDMMTANPRDAASNPIMPDALMANCQRAFDLGGNTPSSFNFSSAGRWLVGDDFSNGWHQAAYASTMYNHVAPPNWTGVDCGTGSAIPDVPGEHAVVSARSNHVGGVNVMYGDGSVNFVSNSVDLVVWRAQGTRAGNETY